MQVKIIRKEPFTVIGKMKKGILNTEDTWIQVLWEDVRGSFQEISTYVEREVSGEIKGIWGISNDSTESFVPCQDKDGEYTAGFEVEQEVEVPEGWTKCTVPGYTYLVVECRKENIRRVKSYILIDYMTKEYFRLAGPVQEKYDSLEGDGTITLYFPIERL